MNEALQNELVEVLKLGKNSVLQAADIIKEQAPELVSQILVWEFVKSFLGFLIFLALLASFVFFSKREVKKIEENDGYEFFDAPFPNAVPMIITGLVTLFSFMVISVESLAWLQILIAPKLFLVEYITDLIK